MILVHLPTHASFWWISPLPVPECRVVILPYIPQLLIESEVDFPNQSIHKLPAWVLAWNDELDQSHFLCGQIWTKRQGGGFYPRPRYPWWSSSGKQAEGAGWKIGEYMDRGRQRRTKTKRGNWDKKKSQRCRDIERHTSNKRKKKICSFQLLGSCDALLTVGSCLSTHLQSNKHLFL